MACNIFKKYFVFNVDKDVDFESIVKHIAKTMICNVEVLKTGVTKKFLWISEKNKWSVVLYYEYSSEPNSFEERVRACIP